MFDGVHLGHLEVIRRAVGLAGINQEPCSLVTFDRHPATVVAPERAPLAVSSLDQNLERFESASVDVCVVLPFDANMANVSADEFFRTVLESKLAAKRIVVGHDFAFGHNREGTPEWLAERIETTVVPPFEIAGHRVSSSAIRQAVIAGSINEANLLLGHMFCLRGIVGHGEKLGRQLGYPTVNLNLGIRQVVPAHGIYVGLAKTRLGSFGAAISVGTRPTVGGDSVTVEAHLLDYPGDDIYGSVVDLQFVSRVRDELKFSNLDELTTQIGLDVEVVRTALSAH